MKALVDHAGGQATVRANRGRGPWMDICWQAFSGSGWTPLTGSSQAQSLGMSKDA